MKRRGTSYGRTTLLPRGVLALAALVLCLLVALDVHARPGGGHTFGGGSGSGGGGGSDDGIGVILWLVIRLAIEVPEVGVPLLVIVVAVIIVVKVREGANKKGWDTAQGMRSDLDDVGGAGAPFGAPRGAPFGASTADAPTGAAAGAARLESLREVDPDFSLVLFEDFLYALFAEAHTHRGGARLERMAPYLAEPARRTLAAYPAAQVRSIVVGAMRVRAAAGIGEGSGGSARVNVTVEFEANYADLDAAGREQAFYAVERWTLSRAASARSRPPDKTRVFGCPSCGAPLEAVSGRTCTYCKKVVDTGDFDWLVAGIAVVERSERPPMLVGDTEEVGTDWPTVVSPDANERWSQLGLRDLAMSWPAFVGRVELVFREFQAAWSAQDLLRMRAYMSDGLFQAQTYWIDAYKRAGLRNTTENARIMTVHLARVVSDRWFDAVTVRVFASGLDYTMDGSGRVVGGSKSRPRTYSEYWTLVRGSQRTGTPRAQPVCPNCGAGLEINMIGTCRYCRAKVCSGEFDWVLSRIEQDEVYGR